MVTAVPCVKDWHPTGTKQSSHVVSRAGRAAISLSSRVARACELRETLAKQPIKTETVYYEKTLKNAHKLEGEVRNVLTVI